MSGLVLEIQQAAMDRTRRVEDVLRMALAAAAKLGVSDIQVWLERELNGYAGLPTDEIPRYRHLRGEVKGWNDLHGWQPIFIRDAKVPEAVSTRPVDSPISELADLTAKPDDGLFVSGYHPDQLKALQKAIGQVVHIRLHVSKSAIVGILDAVRTRTLKWALELESKGVVGDGLTFSSAEKTAAQTIHIGNVENLSAGVIGQVGSGATTTHTQNVGLTAEALGKISGLMVDVLSVAGHLQADDAERIREDIAALKSELEAARRPGHVKRVLASMKGVLENATGGMISKAATPAIQELISRIAHVIGAY
jgi:AbiTii